MLDAVGPRELTVIANTADDVEVYAAHVSPDPDLVTWWLAGLIDERGWGICGRHLPRRWTRSSRPGDPAWFRLGDRDLAYLPDPHGGAARGPAADRGARRGRRRARASARACCR